MSSAIVFPKDFKASSVSITPIKVLDSGAKQAYANYDGQMMTMQVSGLSVPYGMSVFDKAGPIKYSVDLSLKGYDGENVKVKQIYDAFSSLDEHMIDLGVKFSKSWFKSELSRDIIKAFYTPCVRFSKDAEGNVKPYPPTLKIQLKQYDGKFETKMYVLDEERKPVLADVPLEELLVKGAIISSLIKCTGVWFAGSKFGLSWKAIQIRADHLPESIRGFAFRDEDAPSVAAVTQKPAAVNKNVFAALADEDADDEVDDDVVLGSTKPPTIDDDADLVEPIAVPKKPTTLTKKKVVASVKK